MIARTWRGVVRPEDADAYAAYVAETGMPASLATPGNRGFIILRRPTEAGTEIRTISLWGSTTAIAGFAGDDMGRAVFFPEDDRFLVDRDWHVDHYEIAAWSVNAEVAEQVADRSGQRRRSGLS